MKDNELSRRTFLACSVATGVAAGTGLPLQTAGAAVPPPVRRSTVAPEKLAGDESYWKTIADQYDVTREIVQLENGFWGMMPKPVLAAYEQNVAMVNKQNSYYARRHSSADFERVTARVAATLGADPSEIVLTRNATEALQALIGGYNKLKPGDAVLYADLDYDSMISAMNWLQQRRGVYVVRTALPEPATYQGLIDTYAATFDANPRIKLVLLTHVNHRTGLVLPVKEIVALARARGIDAIVDSAHAWGQLDFRIDDIGVDFAGFNLHKWWGAPIGVGAMYIRRSRIEHIDPYMANDEHSGNDIRDRIHTGTTNFAAALTVPQAMDFHESIGIAAKEARVRYLRDLWAERVRDNKAITVLTPSDKRLTCALTSFRLFGRNTVEQNIALSKLLAERFGVFTVHRPGAASGACVRATTALFNSADDVRRLAEALETLAKEGPTALLS